MTEGLGTKSNPIAFDHESPEHAANWQEEFRELRGKCPVAWTNRHAGYWLATSYDAVVEMARNPETFSSEKRFDPATGTGTGGITIPFTPIPRGLPVEADPPGMECDAWLHKPSLCTQSGRTLPTGRADFCHCPA